MLALLNLAPNGMALSIGETYLYLDDDGVGMINGVALDEELKEARIFLRKYTHL